LYFYLSTEIQYFLHHWQVVCRPKAQDVLLDGIGSEALRLHKDLEFGVEALIPVSGGK